MSGDSAAGHPVAAPLAVTWLGHSTVLIELDGVRLLTDPVLGRRVGPLVRIAPPVPSEEVRDVDAVLISHLHADHADLRSLRSVAAPVVAPRGSGSWLGRHGIADVEQLGPGGQLDVGGLTVEATPAVHVGRRWRFGANADSIGLVARGSQSCYFAGDTDLYPQMERLAGSIDIALLPVWGWGSRVGPGHLDPERATTAVAMIVPRVAVPIHWGTFVMGWPARPPADPARPARRFSELVSQAVPSTEVRVLSPGQRTELTPRPRVAAGRDEERT